MNTPPTYLTVQPTGIPAEIRQIPRWVCWQPLWKVNASGVGKFTKVPKTPNGGAGSSTDSATWSTFATVLATYRAGRCAGIGWVLQPPYCGVDFDQAFDQAGRIKPDVLEWVRRFDSYTERSVSGTGLHVLVTADLPPFGHKAGPFECYNTGRYFTLSGHVWTAAAQ